MIAKIKNFLQTHESIFQLIKFMIFSMVAFVVEYASFTILVLCLKSVNQPMDWFVFRYSAADGGTGAFIAFLISNVLAQITSFVINRKKTFNANNNIVFSAVMYAIMVCGIIVLNTYLGSVLTTAFSKVISNVTICQYISKLIGSFVAFCITFVMNKFVIMRRKKEPEESYASDEEAVLAGAAAANGEDTAADVAASTVEKGE